MALAAEMKLAMTEVYEVATFYHHFDVVKEGDAVPPALTVRVCDSLSCEMAGARDLLDRLPNILGPGVRVVPVPCVGRCHAAPVAVVGQNPVDAAPASPRSKPRSRANAIEGADRAVHHVRAVSRRRRLQTLVAASARRRARARSRADDDGELRACAAWAARAFRPGASGASSAPSPRRG